MVSGRAGVPQGVQFGGVSSETFALGGREGVLQGDQFGGVSDAKQIREGDWAPWPEHVGRAGVPGALLRSASEG